MSEVDLNEQARMIKEAKGAPRPWQNPLSGVTAPSVPTSFNDNPQRLDKQAAREALGYEPEIPEDLEDIDPDQWLAHDDSAVTGYVHTRAGRLTLAALTESETNALRKACEVDRVPGNRNSGKIIKVERLRAELVALSLNKAYGWIGTSRELTGKKIMMHDKLSGEISMICNRISQISGMDAGELQDSAPFLSVG